MLYHSCIRFKVPASLRTGWVWWMIPAPPARTTVSPLRSEYKGQICAGKLSLGTLHLLPPLLSLLLIISHSVGIIYVTPLEHRASSRPFGESILAANAMQRERRSQRPSGRDLRMTSSRVAASLPAPRETVARRSVTSVSMLSPSCLEAGVGRCTPVAPRLRSE